EVRKESRVVPVRDARQDCALKLAQQLGEWGAIDGRPRRDLGPDETRLRPGEHGIVLDVGQVPGDPVDERMPFGCEVRRGKVPEWWNGAEVRHTVANKRTHVQAPALGGRGG